MMPCPVTGMGHQHRSAAVEGHCVLQIPEAGDNPLDSHAESNARRGLSSEFLDEAVIPAAANDGALSTLGGGCYLEHRPCVVVEPSY